MDVLEEQAQLGPLLGLEAHKVDAMTHTLEATKAWMFLLEEIEGTLDVIPSLDYPNVWP
jgi:hypothetical protein